MKKILISLALVSVCVSLNAQNKRKDKSAKVEKEAVADTATTKDSVAALPVDPFAPVPYQMDAKVEGAMEMVKAPAPEAHAYLMSTPEQIAWLEKAQKLAHVGQYAKAVEATDSALALTPESSDGRYFRGMYQRGLMYQTGVQSAEILQSILDDFQKCVTLSPSFIPAYMELFGVYAAMGKEEEGCKALEPLRKLKETTKNEKIDMILMPCDNRAKANN